MSDKIHLITHIRNNLLIIMYKSQGGWLFRAVNCAGEILQEQVGFDCAEAAEQAGREWLG